MSIYYKITIKDVGVLAKQFDDSKFIILFGGNAPAEIKDYCYIIDVLPVNLPIKRGIEFVLIMKNIQLQP